MCIEFVKEILNEIIHHVPKSHTLIWHLEDPYIGNSINTIVNLKQIQRHNVMSALGTCILVAQFNYKVHQSHLLLWVKVKVS